jgi:hypothetical protein
MDKRSIFQELLSTTRIPAVNVRQCFGSGFTFFSGFNMTRYLFVEIIFTVPSNALKELSHEMDLAFDEMYG